MHQSTASYPALIRTFLAEKRARLNVKIQQNFLEFRQPSTSASRLVYGTSGITVRPYRRKCHGLTARVRKPLIFQQWWLTQGAYH